MGTNVKIYLGILLQVAGILLLALCAVWGIFSGRAIILGCLGIIVVLVLIGILMHSLNASNRRIQLFLDAIQDDESALLFPEDKGSEDERSLHASFNRVNERLGNLKMECFRQQHFYRALLQYIPDGVVAWNEKGEIEVVNDAALSLLGVDFLRHSSQMEQCIPEFQQVMQEVLVKGTVIVQLRQGMRVRQLALSLNRINLRGEEIMILALKDIGRELSREEYKSWDKLTHVLTHEIMNSIAPVVSLSGVLLSYYQADGVVKEQGEITERVIGKTVRGLDTIRRQGQGLMHFTDSFRRLSFLKTPVPEAFSLSRLLQNLRLLFQTDIEQQHIAFTINTYQPEIALTADEELFSQVLVNLIKNAIQALQGYEKAAIEIRVMRQDVMIIEVVDNGPGVAEEMTEDIFVPFFTTKPQGTGIGLSLSRQIIRMHGGDLQVSSIPYRETRFVITLPLTT